MRIRTANNRPPESRWDNTACAPESMITLLDGSSVWNVHAFREHRGVGDGENCV
jgi:hypothetical protein